MSHKKSNVALLRALLVPLLREWGHDTVQQCLAELLYQESRDDLHAVDAPKPAKEHRRPTAIELVERHDISDAARKDQIRALAAKFDAKGFLPSASDVRDFLGMRGHDPGRIKHRGESFRQVLPVLLDMANDEIEDLRTSAVHSGPTQLGPLSEAIKAVGASRRSGVAEPLGEPEVRSETGDSSGKPADGGEEPRA